MTEPGGYYVRLFAAFAAWSLGWILYAQHLPFGTAFMAIAYFCVAFGSRAQLRGELSRPRGPRELIAPSLLVAFIAVSVFWQVSYGKIEMPHWLSQARPWFAAAFWFVGVAAMSVSILRQRARARLEADGT